MKKDSIFKLIVLLLAFSSFADSRGLMKELKSYSNSEKAPSSAKEKLFASKEAYVTLMYGGFILGARVLGQSLRETGTAKDLVALCTRTVSAETIRVLQADGWIINYVDNIPNPYSGLSKRGDYFSGAYSKIHIWNMTNYERVVYLDSDVLVMSNIDHMFDCGTFCAAFRHSDLFNSGTMVIEPSTAVFEDMIERIPSISSYDKSDQGFLNEYFKEPLISASFFNWSDHSRNHQLMRMPAGLNSDVGMYYINSRWNIPKSEVRIIHYTLGPIKPWFWWTDFLFDLNWHWTAVRKRLPQYSYHNDNYRPAFQPIFWLPYPTLILLSLGLKKLPACPCNRFTRKVKHFSSFYSKLSPFIPLLCLILSYSFAHGIIVPTTMIPSQAEYVFWLWSNSLLVILMCLHCNLCYARTEKDVCNYCSVSSKKLKTLCLYCLFTFSYILVKVVPPLVTPFSWRVEVFLIFLCIHFVTAQIIGLMIIHMWAGHQ